MKTTFISVLFMGCVMAGHATTKSYTTLFLHPGSKTTEAQEVDLILSVDKSGQLCEIHADVDSVICGDGVCELITVRLVWTPLGEFTRYEFPLGGNLTKKDHEEFTAENHEKLLEILRDKDSPLNGVSAADIVTPEEALMMDGEDIDGTTSATLISDKNATVAGAVYTCFTLWHWVNGDLPQEIKGISADEMREEQLVQYLLEGRDAQKHFALNTLSKRGRVSSDIQTAAVRLAMEGSPEISVAAIDYLEGLGAAVYYPVMADLFNQAPPRKQPLFLMSLASTELEPPKSFLDELSKNLGNLKGYYETHLMLNLMTAKNSGSEIVIENAAPLLDNPSFLIARRAYNFLREEDLSSPHSAAIENFATNNAERLWH